MVETSAGGSSSYLMIEWEHDDPDDPTTLYCELDADRWEVRKVEVYRDGRMDFAEADRETGSTWLGEGRMPSVEEINSHGPFNASVITKDAFDQVWASAVAGHSPG